MGFFTDFMQGVRANSALRERVLLAEDKLENLEDEAQRLRDQVSALKTENADLKKRLSEKQQEQNFVNLRGALWLKEADGQYLPHCPKCKLPVTAEPPFHPEFFICTTCKYEPPFTPKDVQGIVASLAQSTQPTATFRDYTCDSFLDLKWRWSYDAKGKVEKIRSFCPKCDRELKSHNSYEISAGDFSLSTQRTARYVMVFQASTSSKRMQYTRWS